MANKLNTITQLAHQTAKEMNRDPEKWMDYLGTASRLYRYSFDDQLLIHAQRPDATACAYMEDWNNKMHRWVKADSTGIAVIRKQNGQRKLGYVFDVSDTRPLRNGKEVWLWQLSEAHHEPVLQAFEKRYSKLPESAFAEQLMEYAARATGEAYRDFVADMHYRKTNSFMEELDELNTEVMFRKLMTASVQYMVLSRCGIDPMNYLEVDDF